MAEPCAAGRRRLLGALGAGALTAAGARGAWAAPDPIPYHGGRIAPPLAVPPLPVQLADGSRTDLAAVLCGRYTALHLMFAGCTTTCPIQGVVFGRVQGLLRSPAQRGLQLLSLSISPLEDTPEAMRAWLARWKAGPDWRAARPAQDAMDTVARLFGSANGSLADHATQVSILNPQAMIVWRTYELPSPETLVGLLNQA